MRHIGTEVGRRCVDLRPSSRATWRRRPAARWSSAPSPSTTMAAVIDDTSCTSCTCCCALSHGSTWQLPNRPYLRSSVLDAVVAHTRPSARRPARRYSAYGSSVAGSVTTSPRSSAATAPPRAAPSSSAGSMWMLRGRQILEPPHSLKSTTRSECSRASAHGRSGGGVCVEVVSASSSGCRRSTGKPATDDDSVCCYAGDWAGTLATTSHSALGCEASGGCELRGDARGERVLSATRRTDCARRRPPSSSHPNIAAQLGERSAGHPAQATRAARRVAAIDSAAATCCRATTHSSTCS